MRNSVMIVGFFTLGLFTGLSGILPGLLIRTDFSVYALYLLMFLVGVGIGSDRESLKILRSANIRILLVPITVIAGTLSGVAAVSLLMPEIDLHEALAVGSGFGYYSLSGIFITRLSGEELGVVALMSNISREIITLLSAPLLVKYFGNIAPIAAGGATSMDTTLPVITKFAGKEYALIAVFSGITLTILVPFLVTFFLA